MVQAMQKKEEHKPRKVKATLKTETLPTPDTLMTLVSRNLLHQLHLADSFLEEDPELWQLNEAFCIANTTIQDLLTIMRREELL